MAIRRGHDEGSIYQRADGRWAASVSLGYKDDGARIRKTVYGKTRKEVAAKLKEVQQAAQAGLPPNREDITIAHLMAAWLEESVKPTVRPNTYRSYEQLTRAHVVPGLGREKLAKVDAQKVQAFLRQKQDTGLSPRTVQYLRTLLRRAFGQAVKWDWVGRNVAALTEPPRMEKGERPSFTPEQAQALLKAFEGHRLGGLFTVMLGLGLRVSEALGLRWQDVHLAALEDSGTATIRVQLQRVEGEWQLTPPKSQAGRRTLGLPGFVARALRERKRIQKVEAQGWAAGTNLLGLVFTTGTGNPLSEHNVRRDFRTVLSKAGLPRQRLHDLRHLCASLLLSQGIHPRVVMEILGHSQISLTMNTYSHVMPEATKAAAQALEDMVSKDRLTR
jgi:integrase